MTTVDLLVIGALFLAILALLVFSPVARAVVRDSFARPTTRSQLLLMSDGSVQVEYDEPRPPVPQG